MKRVFLIFATVFALVLGLRANPVSLETAKDVAVKFMGTSDVRLSAIYQTEHNLAALFIFNTDDGFVIVAADDCETPVIGYSHDNQFDPYDVPVQMEDYLNDFVQRIEYGIENQVVADEVTAKQWAMVKSTGQLNDKKDAKSVEPLLTMQWHQGCRYNSLCPLIETQPCGHAEVGCVAVAMGQIMKYWGFPEVGYGSHSYYSNYGGQLFADFGNTFYEWDLMPDRLTDTSSDAEINAVATLLYHCGVSVNMFYGTGGSGANSNDVPDVLRYYFRYSDELHRETIGDDYGLWLTKIKTCLDKDRPVFYVGNGSASHAFVCDGYDNNDLLHFNWGWGGNGDGYFALGNLHPLGHNFSNSNSAIFDITPDNSPHLVSATPFPPYGGSVEGNGVYIGDQQCVLTAMPAENFEFFYWKEGNTIVSYDSVYSIYAVGDTTNLQAIFSLKSVTNIAANAVQNNVNLTWDNQSNIEWPLLKRLQFDGAVGVVTDGNYIYLSKRDGQQNIWKYTMDGNLVESFALNGSYFPTAFTYDGTYFYCNGENSAYLYTVDLSNHTLISYIRTGYTPICSYDSVRNGIWIALYDSQQRAYRLKLVDPTGALIQQGPFLPSEMVPNGSGFYVGNDGVSHLIIKSDGGGLFDYAIEQDLFIDKSFKEVNVSNGIFIGKIQGKDAMFVCFDNSVDIFEFRHLLWPITQYRLYRSDDKGDITLLSNEVIGTTFTDASWAALDTGLYRYGISSVFANSYETEIIWSNAIPKGNYGLDENTDPSISGVQKVFENGQIVIIKDGKRYNITGQEIK